MLHASHGHRYTFVTMTGREAMALPLRYRHTWHLGETATPFEVDIRWADGTVRTDIGSATLTVIHVATGYALIQNKECEVRGGVLSYRPLVGEMTLAGVFLAQFSARLSGSGYLLPTIYVEGEIARSL